MARRLGGVSQESYDRVFAREHAGDAADSPA
jgi:hypothetical protein